MVSTLATALRATRPVEAVWVGAPALAGWALAAVPDGSPVAAALVASGAWALTLATFAWNDRADAVLSIARGHRRPATRALAQVPGSAAALLGTGWACAIIGLVCFGLTGVVPFCAAVVVTAAGWLYSDPIVFGKSRPLMATSLHLVGGGALAFGGVAAAGGALDVAVAWSASCALVFTAAHLVHQVAGRDEDLAAGVRTSATSRDTSSAATVAVLAVVSALLFTTALGLAVGDVRGMALIVWGLWSVLWVAVVARPALRDHTAWPTFQRRARLAVASGAVLGVGAALLLELDL